MPTDPGRLILSTPITQRSTTMPQKMYTQAQYNAACDLLVTAHTAFVRLKEEHERLKSELRTMQARKKPGTVLQHFSGPPAPDVLSEVVKEQQRRGQRP